MRITFFLVLAVLVASAAWAQYDPEGHFEFGWPGGGAAITNYRGERTVVRIPSRHRQAQVTSIARRAFRERGLVAVTIPGTVTSIGVEAFENNQLAVITIPDGMEAIEAGAFANNLLVSVTIPDNVHYLGNRAFADNRLYSVVIGDGVTHIGNGTFRGNLLTEVIVPAGTVVHPEAFDPDVTVTRRTE